MSIFDPVTIGGDLSLSNRIVMGPMTRSRASASGEAGPHMAEYYAQRASAGLIVSEGVFPSADGKGYFSTPGIETDAQMRSWQPVTDAVHARGGKIFLQLMHCGRVGHLSNKDSDADHVAPSAIAADFPMFTQTGLQPMSMPRALESEEIPGVLDRIERAARNALAGGFDGIELHAASGYLPHQFLATNSNRRTDEWGGTPEKRSRFTVAATERLAKIFGAGRVGVKIAPGIRYNDIHDETEEETYGHLLRELGAMDIAYLSFQTNLAYESLAQGKLNGTGGAKLDLATIYPYAFVRERFSGTVMTSGELNLELASDALERGLADLFVFGRPYIANPDLVERLRRGAPLAETDMLTVYGGGGAGYSDYPALAG